MKNPEWEGNSGVLVKLVDLIMNKHDPPLKLNLLDGWASAQSREAYPDSTFTACTMDVIVGKVDVCIGEKSEKCPFWGICLQTSWC